MKQYSLYLTYDELILLDGKVSEKQQREIDIAKQEHEVPFQSETISEIIASSIRNHKLEIINGCTAYFQCPICKRKSEYPKYKTGINKGKPNEKRKKIEVYGTKLNGVFICDKCRKDVDESVINYIIDNNLEVWIPVNRKTKYYLSNNIICPNCNTIHSDLDQRTKCYTYDGPSDYQCLCGEIESICNRFNCTNSHTLYKINDVEKVGMPIKDSEYAMSEQYVRIGNTFRVIIKNGKLYRGDYEFQNNVNVKGKYWIDLNESKVV